MVKFSSSIYFMSKIGFVHYKFQAICGMKRNFPITSLQSIDFNFECYFFVIFRLKKRQKTFENGPDCYHSLCKIRL